MRQDTANSRTNFSGPPECAVHADPTTITPMEFHPRHLCKLEREIDGPHDERNPKVKTRPEQESVEYKAISQWHEDIYKPQHPRITSSAHQKCRSGKNQTNNQSEKCAPIPRVQKLHNQECWQADKARQ